MTSSADSVDVVIVGAGIAGGALATLLARGGRSVMVVERSTEYVDRVRGEFLMPWGVAEAKRIGVYDNLVGAGGNLIDRFVGYDEVRPPEAAEAAPLVLTGLVPGVDGAISIGHPAACKVLQEAAESAGATVLRGISDLSITLGETPTAAFSDNGLQRSVSCRLIVGADGRESTVRRHAGIVLKATEPRLMLAGLLVEGLAWPASVGSIGTEDDRIFYVFAQNGGRARLYLGYKISDKSRFSGHDKASAFLDAFNLNSIPHSERFRASRAAGPCATFPMFDTWTDHPAVDGAVLVGDAAGSSDPTLGQGLSIALRDARTVGEGLLASDDWSSATFVDYTTERADRMRRLRVCAQVSTDAHIPLGAENIDERRRRMKLAYGGDPDLSMLLAAALRGPETPPESAFTDDVRNRMLTSD